MKNRRHFMIMDLIGKMRIETQEELCTQLRQQGFNVTQATVSRDIKEMGLLKLKIMKCVMEATEWAVELES